MINDYNQRLFIACSAEQIEMYVNKIQGIEHLRLAFILETMEIAKRVTCFKREIKQIKHTGSYQRHRFYWLCFYIMVWTSFKQTLKILQCFWTWKRVGSKVSCLHSCAMLTYNTDTAQTFLVRTENTGLEAGVDTVVWISLRMLGKVALMGPALKVCCFGEHMVMMWVSYFSGTFKDWERETFSCSLDRRLIRQAKECRRRSMCNLYLTLCLK